MGGAGWVLSVNLKYRYVLPCPAIIIILGCFNFVSMRQEFMHLNKKLKNNLWHRNGWVGLIHLLVGQEVVYLASFIAMS